MRHGFEVGLLVATLGARNDRELLGLGFGGRGNDGAYTRGINRDGFFHEHVLAGRDGCGKVLGSEMRRCCQNHHVDIRSQNLLESIEPRKGGLWCHGRAGLVGQLCGR